LVELALIRCAQLMEQLKKKQLTRS
jgi:hypothetical protein